MAKRWGLLLINLGTPEAPTPSAVRRYLREFLSDPRVIDIAAWKRSLLLNAVILPFRPKRSAAAYREVWTDEGSPLLVHGRALQAKLQARLGDGCVVELGMRYGQPSIAGALAALQAAGVDRVVAFPLFPQWASSSYGSAAEELYRAAGAMHTAPHVQLLEPYYAHPAYVRALAQVARPALAEANADRVLFSFHGLPERHMRTSDFSGRHCLASADCCAAIGEVNRYCYRAQSYATARALGAALGLPDDGWEVAFQSRLGRDPWIQPFTDVRVPALAQEGVRRLAVAVPSFTADCLETLEEIGIRAKDDFLAAGGESLSLVPCLNAADPWAEAVVEIVGESVPEARAAASA